MFQRWGGDKIQSTGDAECKKEEKSIKGKASLKGTSLIFGFSGILGGIDYTCY